MGTTNKTEGIKEEELRRKEEELRRMEEGNEKAAVAAAASSADNNSTCNSIHDTCCASSAVVSLTQKVVAETIGTYLINFAGCGSVVVNHLYGEKVTFPGICVTWGLIVMVMVMVYSLGHISGAHFNPAVSLSNRSAPLYMIAQFLGALLSSVTLTIMFDVTPKAFFGTVPVGSDLQSFSIEIIISFLLMFVICGVATDTQAVGELAGIAVGMTVVLNVFVAGPISGASMNPARTLGPAIVKNNYKGIWVYMVGPPIGAIAGAFVYNLVRYTNKPLREITKTPSFLQSGPTK